MIRMWCRPQCFTLIIVSNTQTLLLVLLVVLLLLLLIVFLITMEMPGYAQGHRLQKNPLNIVSCMKPAHWVHISDGNCEHEAEAPDVSGPSHNIAGPLNWSFINQSISSCIVRWNHGAARVERRGLSLAVLVFKLAELSSGFSCSFWHYDWSMISEKKITVHNITKATPTRLSQILPSTPAASELHLDAQQQLLWPGSLFDVV